MPNKLRFIGIAAISETKILLVGGKNEGGTQLDTSQIYDTELKTYTEISTGWTPSEGNSL